MEQDVLLAFKTSFRLFRIVIVNLQSWLLPRERDFPGMKFAMGGKATRKNRKSCDLKEITNKKENRKSTEKNKTKQM